MASETKKLLEDFILHNPDLQQLEQALEQFNIFEAIGMVKQETKHSRFLAFLLDPNQNHGLGDHFLKQLLMNSLTAENAPFSLIDIDVTDFDHAIVLTEWRNIDIFIYDETAQVTITIENKVFSSEHSNQLGRYREIVQHEYPHYRHIFLFLTPEEIPPTGEEDLQIYIPISYSLIARILEQMLDARQSTLGADVVTLIRHYTMMLRRHILNDSEIAELCRKIYQRHKQALDLIFEHRPDMQTQIADYLTELIKAQPFRTAYWTKTFMQFYPTEWFTGRLEILQSGVNPWHGQMLRFQIDNRVNFLTLKLIVGAGPTPIRSALVEIASQNKPLFKASKLRSQWNTIYSRVWLKDADYQDSDLDDLVEKINTEWSRFLNTDLPAIRQVIEESIDWQAIKAQIHDQ